MGNKWCRQGGVVTSGQGREGKREQSEWVVGMMQGSVRKRRACRGWRVAPASARAWCKPLPQAACRRCRADVAAIAVGARGGGGGQGQIYVTMAPGRCLPGARARGITQLAACYATVGPIVPGGTSAGRAHHAPARPPVAVTPADACLAPTQEESPNLRLVPCGPQLLAHCPAARQLGVRITLQPARPGYPHPAHSTGAQSAPQLQCLGGRRAHEGSGPLGTSGWTLPSEGRNAGNPATRARPTAGKPRSAGMGAGHG